MVASVVDVLVAVLLVVVASPPPLEPVGVASVAGVASVVGVVSVVGLASVVGVASVAGVVSVVGLASVVGGSSVVSVVTSVSGGAADLEGAPAVAVDSTGMVLVEVVEAVAGTTVFAFLMAWPVPERPALLVWARGETVTGWELERVTSGSFPEAVAPWEGVTATVG